MIGIAAGLTIGEKFRLQEHLQSFSTGRVYDQIRQSVAYSDKKCTPGHAGLTLGEDGATHQILEDMINENASWNDRNQHM
jgi:transketolase